MFYHGIVWCGLGNFIPCRVWSLYGVGADCKIYMMQGQRQIEMKQFVALFGHENKTLMEEKR